MWRNRKRGQTDDVKIIKNSQKKVDKMCAICYIDFGITDIYLQQRTDGIEKDRGVTGQGAYISWGFLVSVRL